MDLNLFWHSIRASAGNSFLWETAGPNIFRGEYHDSFNMDLMCKDIQLCFEMAKSAKVRLVTLSDRPKKCQTSSIKSLLLTLIQIV